MTRFVLRKISLNIYPGREILCTNFSSVCLLRISRLHFHLTSVLLNIVTALLVFQKLVLRLLGYLSITLYHSCVLSPNVGSIETIVILRILFFFFSLYHRSRFAYLISPGVFFIRNIYSLSFRINTAYSAI